MIHSYIEKVVKAHSKETSERLPLLPGTTRCVLFDDFPYPNILSWSVFSSIGWGEQMNRTTRWEKRDPLLCIFSRAIAYDAQLREPLSPIRCAKNAQGKLFIVDDVVTGRGYFPNSFAYVPLEEAFSRDPTLRQRLLVFGIDWGKGLSGPVYPTIDVLIRTLRRAGYDTDRKNLTNLRNQKSALL